MNVNLNAEAKIETASNNNEYLKTIFLCIIADYLDDITEEDFIQKYGEYGVTQLKNAFILETE